MGMEEKENIGNILSPMFKICVILVSIFSCLGSQYLTDFDGVDNFQRYYKCYFDKYFKIEDDGSNLGREEFVRELLTEALTNNEKSPKIPMKISRIVIW